MKLANSRDMGEMQVESLENQLKRSLRRIEPNQQFVDHLHNRLKTPDTMVLEHRQNTALGLLIVAFSLLSGVFLVWIMRQLRSAFDYHPA